MQAPAINLYTCQRIMSEFGGVKLDALFDLSQLTTRNRSALITALQRAYISTNVNKGTGMLAKMMLDATGMFYVTGTRGKYATLNWRGPKPAWFDEALKPILEADKVATEVSGEKWSQYSFYGSHLRIHTLKLLAHIPPLLAPHSGTLAYQEAVEPYIEAVRNGDVIPLRVLEK
jgi:hypothetical protein